MIAERTAQLEALCDAHFRAKREERTRRADSGSAPLSDEEIIERARSAANGAKFMRLWAGDTSEYGGDDSAADLALLGILAFWTQDPAQLDRLFRRSGLYREKWERADYREHNSTSTVERGPGTAHTGGAGVRRRKPKGGRGDQPAPPPRGSRSRTPPRRRGATTAPPQKGGGACGDGYYPHPGCYGWPHWQPPAPDPQERFPPISGVTIAIIASTWHRQDSPRWSRGAASTHPSGLGAHRSHETTRCIARPNSPPEGALAAGRQARPATDAALLLQRSHRRGAGPHPRPRPRRQRRPR